MTETAFPPVMLLAAGLGTRLRPLTATTPKPLVEVAGQKLIDRVISTAQFEGAGNFVVNGHYLAGQLRNHVQSLDNSGRGRFVFSDETAGLLDTGGGVKKALPLLDGDPILVMNTDAFWQPGADRPLARMRDSFARQGAELVLLCVHPFRATGFRRSHDFCLAPDGEITDDRGAPVIYAGSALIARHLFDDTPEGKFSLNLLFERTRAAGTLRGVALGAPWHHVGDPEGLAEAERALR